MASYDGGGDPCLHPGADHLSAVPALHKVRLWKYDKNLHLAWSEYGDPSGHPVFLHHGWPGSQSQARLAHQAAKARRLRIISFDRPGMGQSTFVPGRTMADFPNLVAKFADHLHLQKFSQIAVSGGGPYAIACAAHLADRLTGTAILAGLVPLHSLPNGIDSLNLIYRLIIPLRHLPPWLTKPFFTLIKTATRLESREPPVSWVIRHAFPESERRCLEDPAIWEIVTQSIRAALPGPAAGPMLDAKLYFESLDFDPTKITHPIRLWHGEKDLLIRPDLLRKFARTCPAANLTVSPDSGHISLAVTHLETALDYLRDTAR